MIDRRRELTSTLVTAITIPETETNQVITTAIITRRVITTTLTETRTVIGTITHILITVTIIISPLTACIVREIPTPVMVKDITSQIEITITIIVRTSYYQIFMRKNLSLIHI